MDLVYGGELRGGYGIPCLLPGLQAALQIARQVVVSDTDGLAHNLLQALGFVDYEDQGTVWGHYPHVAGNHEQVSGPYPSVLGQEFGCHHGPSEESQRDYQGDEYFVSSDGLYLPPP